MSDRHKLYSYIITFRDGGQGRLKNLLAVLDRVSGLGETEILVAEQDKRPTLDRSSMPAGVRHLFLANPGPFNKSWAFNVCARRARGGVLAFADADIIVDNEVVEACLDACRTTHQAINPYGSLLDLDAEQTGEFLRTGEVRADPDRGVNRIYKGEHLCFCGGMYVVRKEDYIRLGGQDEDFRGWGGEDDAMSIKVGLLQSRVENRTGVAYHLFHRAAPGRAQDDDYRRNLELLRTYHRMTPGELWALCARHRRTMGDPEKYV